MARQKLSESIPIPAGISCEIRDKIFFCKKDAKEFSLNLNIPGINSSIKDNQVTFSCESGNKKDYKTIKSMIVHVKNVFLGIENKFVYKLEAANVHFPMTFKVEKDKFVINNFLGEKKPRITAILPDVDVEVKGAKITVSSGSKEAAGQTAANLEKATKVRNRDRRVFQDGIYIVEKPLGGGN